jgi:hypothetical protein
MKPLGEAAARIVERLAAQTHDDPDRVVEKTICDFLRAQSIDVLEHNGALFACGQFWSINRAGGRTITSVHLCITDMAEAVVTQLQIAQRS